ncbi:ABC transporter substrate-binding protein [Sphingomonas sabuli]|uniref:ABC transporter substrate-binding protein n=1 Tax=Sphingomonas sabuli TaxID=2764186 RepID=A0A7G9L4R9_9SPHN|nr:ABC transporter substrate-binding protein [Sphingomonas sabuli]QNM83618.1 ABC transporter substrate-binding protein [Sphingomonas sabuli]
MLNTIRRPALAAALAATLAVLSGCDGKSEGVPQVIVIGAQPRLAEPAKAMSAGDSVLADSVAQGLVRFDARGQVEPGLAETWNVSDDGLSYIFRLASTKWPEGRKVTAEQVARMLRRKIASGSRNPLRDTFGAVDEIVAMTDRVLEIRLAQPRPHLLQLLAQPEMGLINDQRGTGPFLLDSAGSKDGRLRLVREVPVPDEDEMRQEQLLLSGAAVKDAVAAFIDGGVELVLGGTFNDLPVVQAEKVPRGALRFDPAAGLFGLMPVREGGLVDDPQVRQLLSQSIDRQALIDALAVPGLLPRSTVLEPALDTGADPVAPEWSAVPLTERQAGLVAAAARMFGADDKPTLYVALPDGPGADILFNRLKQDWGALGIEVQRAEKGGRADLTLIDEVAPATSAAWYLRHFRCDVAVVCDVEIDEMLAAARNTAVLDQRSALLTEASRKVDAQQLFIPLAAPIRWSLVSSRVTGFAGNRFAIHSLTGLEQPLLRTGQ